MSNQQKKTAEGAETMQIIEIKTPVKIVKESSQKNNSDQKLNILQPSDKTEGMTAGDMKEDVKEAEEEESELKGFKGASKEVRLAKSKKLLMSKFSSYIEGEEVLETFICTFIGKILLSGKMYVTNKRVLHRSYFNDKTLFGKGTRIFIMGHEIVHVEKRCYNDMKMLPNTIFLKASNEKGEVKEYTFTSYLY